MSAFKEFVVHTSNYFAGQCLVLLAGFISMPIMTRLLSKEQYGLMNLVFLTVTLLGTIAHLGFAPAIARFYAEYKKRGDTHLKRFCSNILFGSTFSGMFVTLVTILVCSILEGYGFGANTIHYLKIYVIIIVIRIIISTSKEMHRADMRYVLFNITSVCERYISLSLSIILFLIYKDIIGIFLGIIFAEGSIAIALLIYQILNKKVGLVKISKFLLSEANKYGLPFVLTGLSTFILDLGDRYVIQYFLNSEAVATYSVAYDASNYLANLTLTPIRLALVPMVFSLWVNQGNEATAAFTSKALKYIFALIIPMIFGFSLLGREVITLLASAKYADASELVPCIIAGVLIGGLDFILAAGLRAQKRTTVVALIALFSCVLNILLNYISVPYYGLQSSAIITLATYLLRTFMLYKVSLRYLNIHIDLRFILKSFFSSIIMSVAILIINSTSNNIILDIFAKIIVGLFCYILTLLCISRDTREELFMAIKSRKLSFGVL